MEWEHGMGDRRRSDLNVIFLYQGDSQDRVLYWYNLLVLSLSNAICTMPLLSASRREGDDI
jgi:hypothetical protein